MSILTIAWTIAGAICFSFALLFLFIWIKSQKHNYYLLFTSAAVGAGLSAFTELWALHTIDPHGYGTVMIWQNVAIFILLVSLVWFIDIYFQTAKRWITLLISALWCFSLIINMFSPYSLVYSYISAIERIQLPWGEYFSIPNATLNPWRYIADITSILIVIFLIDASIRLWRKGNRQRALVVGGATVLFIVIAGIHTPLVDAGIIVSPYAISFAFMAIILAMGLQLSNDVVKSAFYSEEVKRNEKRWRTLLENVPLMVVGLDNQAKIQYVNPYFLQTTGYQESDILQQDWFQKFIAKTDRSQVRKAFEKIETNVQYQKAILTKSGEQRIISWSNVQLFDSENKKKGTLSIGEDITERLATFEEIRLLKERLEEENIYLQEEMSVDKNFGEIVGKSSVMKYALNRITQVAPTDMTVLIEGETGVGKERFARALHQSSNRKDRLLVKVNCAAIQPNLIESEMFGHVKGAFTGATHDRTGRFELADGGTIFLDEIAELPLELQAKLLRVLEEGEIEPLGSEKTIKVDVRVIAATNRVLKDEVQAGQFREDLYYRISAYPISVPPLRKREEDIPLLLQKFVEEFSRSYGKSIQHISKSTIVKLQEYDWPGNIREMRHVIERAVLATGGSKLHLDEIYHLSEGMISQKSDYENMTLEHLERQHIQKILKECNGKISGNNGAAKILGMHPNTLRFRMQKLGIQRDTVS
jgi:PAS domain S-box-containing protein